MKKEMIEEAAERLYPYEIGYGVYDRNCEIDFERERFIEGAKWQQERSYSEEDMRTAWNSSEQNMRFNFSSLLYKNITFEQWIEQFKNK